MKVRIILALALCAMLAWSQGSRTGGGQGIISGVSTFNTRAGAVTLQATDIQGLNTAFLTADYTNATTTFSNLTGLAFAVLANTSYHLHCNLIWSASAVTAGPKYQVTGPAAPTAVVVQMNSAITATTIASAAATAFSSSLNPVGAVVTSGAAEYSTLDLDLRNGANAGTLQVQAAAQGTGTLTVSNASGCQIQ